ncbi:DUF262 domain-containing protein [Desulfococcaceae bacterium HSG8]|nr:DUF262 domain-containing protein [Desulfococcaceae bacterium HSG8]
MSNIDGENWYEDGVESEDNDYQIEEYDITASPNDFNVKTIFDFIGSGVVKIPGFQRNYVWDLGRASKLIESIIIGLPVPQIFLYEEKRNHFLVIDGQQRLMTIYYFIKQCFPKKEKRSALRAVFAEHGHIPDSFLNNDEYFEEFSLKLPSRLPDQPNRFDGLSYSMLDEYKASFELRTIRNVIIKQNMPKNDDSSIYEIFSRLNSGGVNLTTQEIRMSLYHSDFYTMLHTINTHPQWRTLLGFSEPDINMKDIEILLRGFAMLVEGESYKPSMVKFLNNFSQNCKAFTQENNSYLKSLFHSFVESCSDLPEGSFSKKGKFNISLYESVFAAICGKVLPSRSQIRIKIDPIKLKALREDTQFISSSKSSTTSKANVKKRLERARLLLLD